MARQVLTLVTPTQAKKGAIFSVRILPKCKKCSFYKVCVGKLREGIRYKVMEVRNVKHRCPVINDLMYVAVVEEMPAMVAVEKRKAVDGLSFRYEKIKCDKYSCPYYKYCVDVPVKDREKIVIKKILKSIPCSRRLQLVLVEAEILG